ncbi:MAG: sigma-70 family RNA polymerase sigma factor [Myxococcota bacterium]|nr:sigma-70 family RNA polymerase sigma factor [Myxococcota bacterium]
MATVDPRELLEHTSWLRQLARSLVTEGADDLVQDTWVAALRRPPRGDHGVRPWLRKVVTNAARLRWRSDAHRTAREQVVAHLGENEVPSPAQLLERHELQQVLARLVSELDEPFRSTILLRFGEGLTPTEIARRLSVPAGTVRWRLKEALARLRTDLDALHRGDRRAWIVAFAPLVMPRSSPAVPIIPLALAIAAAAACMIAIIAVGTSALQSGNPAISAERFDPRAQVPGVHASAPALTPLTPLAFAWLAQEGVPPREISGRVSMHGAPVPGATVRLLADPLSPRVVETDPSGRFTFGAQPPREYTLGASRPGKLAAIRRIDLRDPSAPHDVELVLQDCAASLHGKVVDAAGTPIEGAQLFREGVIGVETDRTGSYELCTLPTAALIAEIRVVVRAHGFGTIAVPLAPPGRMHHDFVLAPEATVSGRVVDGHGEPMVSAQISIDVTGPAASVPPERGVSLTGVSDSDGGFRVSGLAAGEYKIAATSARAATGPVDLKLEAAENRTIELRAAGTGTVRGRVLSSGLPIAGVTVAANSEIAISQADGSFVLGRVPVGDVELKTRPYKRTSGPIRVAEGDHNVVEVVVEPMGILRGTVRRRGVPVPFARVGIHGPTRAGVTTDETGRYEARGLEPGQYGFYSDDRRRGAMFAQDRAVDLGPAETREYDIELAWGGSIAGHVVDVHGNAVSGVAVDFRAASDCLTDATGAFSCGGLVGGAYTPSVRPASATAHAFRFVEQPPTFELRDGDARIDGVRLVVEATLQEINGTVTERDGGPVADAAVRAFAVNRTQRGNGFQRDLATITSENGRFRINDLSPGDYYVEVESLGLAVRQTVSAGATNVALVLERPPCEGAGAREIPTALVRPSTSVVWSRQIELVGWVLPSTMTANRPIEMTLVYRTLKPLDRDWRIFAHFDSQATRVNGDHDPAIGWCPTSQWRAGDMIADRVSVQFEQPGRYSLTIGFFTGSAPHWENMSLSAVPPAMKSDTQGGVRITEIVVK